MKVYVVTVMDRDLVSEVKVFKTKEEAEQFAESIEQSYEYFAQIFEEDLF